METRKLSVKEQQTEILGVCVKPGPIELEEPLDATVVSLSGPYGRVLGVTCHLPIHKKPLWVKAAARL